jgi:hypothetical protein
MRRDGVVTTRHAEDCQCVRCVGFLPANKHSLRHGAMRSEIALAADPATRELVEAITAQVPFATPGAEIQVELLGVTLRRVQLAVIALDRADEEGHPEKYNDLLRRNLNAWINTAAKISASLALTPASYARLTRDMGLATDASVRAQSALERLHAHLDEQHGKGSDE